MAFTSNSRNFRIVGSKLVADVQTPNGSAWNPWELDLNRYLENLYGSFDTRSGYGNFYPSSRKLSINNQGVLFAELNSGGGSWVAASIDLKVFVGVDAGILLFKQLAYNTGIDTTATTVSLNGSVFSAFLMGYDGRMHYHELDLDKHYANVNGYFRSNSGDKGFYALARNVRLGEGNQTFILKADLRVGSGWRATEVNLAADIVNNYARLRFVGRHTPPPSFWRKFLEVFEGVPFVGFVVAGIYALMGNREAAQRAISLSANSTIVMTGAVIGGLLGGPWGAAIGAAVTTPIGIFLETSLSPTQQTATIERYIFETLRNAIAAGAGGALSAWLNRLSTSAINAMFSEVNRAFGGKIASGVISSLTSSVKASFKKIFDAIVYGVFPPEWRAVDIMVVGLVAARTIQSFALSELQPLDEYAPINEYIVLDTPASAGDAEFKALGGSDSLDKGKGVGESDSPGEGKALGSEPLDEAKESNTSDVVETN